MVLDGRATGDGLYHLYLALDEALVQAEHGERLARTHPRQLARDARLRSGVGARVGSGVWAQGSGRDARQERDEG